MSKPPKKPQETPQPDAVGGEAAAQWWEATKAAFEADLEVLLRKHNVIMQGTAVILPAWLMRGGKPTK